MIEKTTRVCAGCKKQQLSRPGMRCRFCGDSRVWGSLDGPRPGAAKPWEHMSSKRHVPMNQLPEMTQKMVAVLAGEHMTYRDFLNQYNKKDKRYKHGLDIITLERLKTWTRGTAQPPREVAMRIARMIKARGYSVWECPFFHPHAAMRTYTKEYYTYWKKHREWFRNNPGKDPGPWWDYFKPEGEPHEQ